jgi:hypothetical protein
MMTSENRISQVVEACFTALTAIALPIRLGVIAAMTGHVGAAASRTPDAIWPAVLPNQIETLRIVD